MNYPQYKKLKLASAILTALGMSAAASLGFAQDEELEEVVVTGTLIKNANFESSSPIQVVTRDEIDLQAALNAEEILREIPGVVPSIGANVNNGNGGFSYVNLRGVGSNRNVVLIDGVRLAP